MSGAERNVEAAGLVVSMKSGLRDRNNFGGSSGLPPTF